MGWKQQEETIPGFSYSFFSLWEEKRGGGWGMFIYRFILPYSMVKVLNCCFLFQYSKYPTSIAALSFSRDGRLLAVASSYTFEEGPKQ